MPFVNWRAMNTFLCTAMWLVALVLVVVILAHVLPTQAAGAHPAHAMLR